MTIAHSFTSGPHGASVLAQGAELSGLRLGAWNVLWDAGPAWPRHAPLLFPIVGAVRDDAIRVDGREYRMGKHGFARDRAFRFTRRDADGCTLVLEDDAETRAIFPFAFRLELDYRLCHDGLHVRATVANSAEAPLPCSLGFHPAFRWPLSGATKEGHRIVLDAAEAASIAQIDPDGLVHRRVPNPLEGGQVLALSDVVFGHDALIFEPVRSTSARLEAPDGGSVTVRWDGASALGIWSKPAEFVCIEPWRGWADPAGFTGEFRDKPGVVLVPPGQSLALGMHIEAQAASDG